MSDYINTTERIIADIKEIDGKVNKVKLKDLVLELADHISKGIDEKRPEVLQRFKVILSQDTQRPRGQDGINKKLISLLIQKIAAKNFTTISKVWIINCLPDEYKEVHTNYPKKETMISADEISDANLLNITQDLKKRMRDMENLGPAKEIKIKNELHSVRNHNWTCDMADELIKLAIKIENEHEHDHKAEYCEKSAKAIRMARDKRFATTYSRYQAIVVSAEFTRSLASLAGDEVEVLSRWAVHDNEKQCRECLDLIHCRAEKCNHGCHDFKKEMTTKGIKWAMRETQELNELEKHMAALNSDSDDMCDFIKTIMINPKLKMTHAEKKNIMAKHMKIDRCDQCVYFTTEHPNFFKEHLE